VSALAFATPWLLAALVLLPVLWWLLRAVPPAPIRRRFPGVALLLGLRDDESQTATTPWWLLLLRMLAVAAVIVGFAGPVLNPREETPGRGPLLLLLDGGWPSAADWQARIARAEDVLEEAGRDGRAVAVLSLADPLPEAPSFQAADGWIARLPGLAPRPWAPDLAAAAALDAGGAEIVWISDGLDHPGRAEAVAALAPSRVILAPRPVLALRPAAYRDGAIALTAVREGPVLLPQSLDLRAVGPGPNGAPAELGTAAVEFEAGAREAEVEMALPPELRNRVQRFELSTSRSAGSVTLADETLRRREVALLTDAEDESQELLSPLYYLRNALEPTADLIEGDLATILPANPDVLVMADVAQLSALEAQDVADWVEAGGLLLRFAGPRLASSEVSRAEEDTLMPVRLRSGGRTIGGALSWGEPRALRPFAEDGPFAGLAIPEEVTVSSQVMAQPDPTLAQRAIAALADGTPLVTRKPLGQGQIVLFHVTANAEWSTLPLSGLFVQMLERLAIAARTEAPDAAELEGTTWEPRIALDGFGAARDAGDMAGVPGEALAAALEAGPTAEVPPGLYQGQARAIALDALGPRPMPALVAWPGEVAVEGLARPPEIDLMPYLLTLALLLLALDVVASLWLGGRLASRTRRAAGTTAAALALAVALAPAPAPAQQVGQGGASGPAGAAAPGEGGPIPERVSLAHVLTGDARVDYTARAGLEGLSLVLTRRTSVEPEAPRGVDLESDELAFYPLLYWPVTAAQPTPSPEAYARLNRYLRSGGMIVFDTQDAGIPGGDSRVQGRLRDLAGPLDVPPLEVLPPDHVLTRAFYLLQDFPGRWNGREVWVEASPAAEQVEGMPFRNLNDGVTPVLIGGNDWAAAWAVNGRGDPMLPVGSGFGGERQREIAYRFGVNLVMHVLSGNYKSDQVHVPALLDRLGN
jgi:hypothetical protein